MTSPSLPDRARVLTSTQRLPEGTGAVWRLDPMPRDLDANVVSLPAGDGVAAHDGPEVDVLVHVIDGSGHLVTASEADDVPLQRGDVVWLPRGSRRGFAAGPHGLRYLTVHQKRRALQIGRPPA